MNHFELLKYNQSEIDLLSQYICAGYFFKKIILSGK